MEQMILGWVSIAVLYGTIFASAALGETINEKAGHLNLGVPGIMYLAGIVSYLSIMTLDGVLAPSLCVIISLFAGIAVGAVFGLLYSFFCVTLRCNQNVMGLAIASFGVGFGKFFSILFADKMVKLQNTAPLYSAGIVGLKDIPYVGAWLFNYGFPTYLVLILLILAIVFFNCTRVGLNLKAVGESPSAADAAGINVTGYKYLATTIGCGFCGLGGVIYVLDFSGGVWSTNNNIEAIGWLAIALVIFASWKPKHLIWGAPLFGLLFWAYQYATTVLHIPPFTGMTEVMQMLPYLATIVILIVNSLRKKKENQPPESLGLAYFREER